MKVKNKVIVVTGGASGIGRALCRRFAQEGARAIAVVDINEEGAMEVAREIKGLAIKCDVRKEEEINHVVNKTEDELGPIDIFCSNAGIMVMGGVEVPTEDWQRIWEVNVMAHIFAAKAMIPRMIKRGGGYLLNTVSAAGLLSQIGSAPYSVTKHAAIGLAENIAITYGDQGIKVSVICPQAVRTEMTADGGGVAALDGILEPEDVAQAVIEGLEEERFLILPHPQVKTYMERKVMDYDRWLNGMRRLQRRYLEGKPLKG
jgi:NAD(P)-dependent dehydrogenase (short-subunit alcohol dehydrogenase family)